MSSTLSLLGMYSYDNSIFTRLNLPQGVDRETLVNSILMETAELEVLYSDPAFMRDAIGVWSTAELQIWDKLVKTTSLEYNPIWNKDGTIKEKWTDTYNKTNEVKASSEASGSAVNQVAGYNSEDFQNRDKNSSGSEGSSESTATDTGTIGRVYERTEQGNIGVTSTQQLIKEEREISTFNIYAYIVTSFKNRFCLLVY